MDITVEDVKREIEELRDAINDEVAEGIKAGQGPVPPFLMPMFERGQVEEGK